MCHQSHGFVGWGRGRNVKLLWQSVWEFDKITRGVFQEEAMSKNTMIGNNVTMDGLVSAYVASGADPSNIVARVLEAVFPGEGGKQKTTLQGLELSNWFNGVVANARQGISPVKPVHNNSFNTATSMWKAANSHGADAQHALGLAQ